jgi:phage terminase large subunit-like protein
LKSSEKVDVSNYSKYNAYIGVDLAAVSDLTAVSLMIPTDDKFVFKTWYYLPQSALVDNSNAELYKKWKRQGLLKITNGNVTDYDEITNDIMKLGEVIPIQSIAYDTWNSTSWAIQMTELGQPLEPFSQALGNFNRPTKEIERLIKSDKVVIDDNEITRFCFGNVVLKHDWNDNVKPTKEENQQKIDGVIAMTEALGIYLTKVHYDNKII